MADSTHIVFAANLAYLPYLSTALTSVRHNADPSERLAVTVLSRELTPSEIPWANRGTGDSIRCVSPGVPPGTVLPLRSGDHVSEETYYRLFIDRVFDDTVRRVVYLDADLVALGDVTRLAQTPLKGRAVAAALDSMVRRWGSVPVLAARGSAETRYFNAGVLLIDLKAWRRRGVAERALRFLQEAGDSVSFWDQDALNHALHEDWVELHPRWNRMSDYWIAIKSGDTAFPPETLAELASPQIVHFASRVKPWQNRHHPDRPHFDRYAAMAGFGHCRMTATRAAIRKLRRIWSSWMGREG